MSAQKNVCIVGMGYVGLTLAVGMAASGYTVLGIENNPDTLRSLQAGKPHFFEDGISEKFAEFHKKGSIVVRESIVPPSSADAYIITVGTTVGKDKKTLQGALESVTKMIARAMNPDSLVVLRSTVKVGTSRQFVKPLLDAAGVPYFLAMCPERTLEGHAFKELSTLPQIVGGIDAESTKRAGELFYPLSKDVIPLSSPEAAELAKLVCNTQRDLFFAYGNEVAMITEALGLNASEVIDAANRRYPRSRVAKPGLVGGPCLEKDTYILAEGLESIHMKPELVLHGRTLNEGLLDWGIERVAGQMKKMGRDPGTIRKIAILGLAFKGRPATSDIRGSLALALRDKAAAAFPNAEIVGYDPVADVAEAATWGFAAAQTMDAALTGADLAFIQNNHPRFSSDELVAAFARMGPDGVVYDFWNCLERGGGKLDSGVWYMGLGNPVV